MYVEDPLCQITIFIHSFSVGVLLIFTCVENPANSRARKGVWLHVLRFECICIPISGS